MDVVAVEIGIAHGVGDGGGVNVHGRFLHGLEVFLAACVRHKGHRGGNAHGHGLGRHNVDLFLGQLGRLLRRQNDV